MRVVTATLIILVVFIVSGFMLDNYINNTADDLLKDIKTVNKLIEDNDWNNAKKELSNLKEKWLKTEKKWQLFLEHYEMDSIDVAMVKLVQYVEIESRTAALGAVAELRLLVSHIKEKESFKLENVL